MAEAFPISGNIDPSTFPFLLADLHRQGATGSLKVDGPSYPKALYFRGGRVLFGSSNDPKDQLGSILIESGKINQEQLDDVNTKVGPGNPLAKVLAESGYVNQRELSDAARVKVERILSDVISYTSGGFEFEDGVLPKGAVDLKLSTEKLVLAAVARLSDRGFVLRHLESLGVVLAPAPDMGERIGELRPDAGELPERFDGHRTLKDAASLTRLDEFEAAKIACALLFLGLVHKPAATATDPQAADELDLAQTARMAFDPSALAAPPSAEPAFYMPEAESNERDGIDTTMPDTPAPRFGSSETPPLGVSVPNPPGFAPASLASDESEGEPTVVGFNTSETAGAPAAFPLSEPDEPTMPRLGFPSSPPTTATFDRAPATPQPPPPQAPDFAPAPLAPPPPLAFEEEPAREAVAPARPSKEDLAALDALLNPSASTRSGTVPPARPRTERWEPQFRPNAPATAARPNRRRGGGLPVVPLAAGAALLLATAAGAWYYFNRQPPPAPKPVARATPPPAPTTTTMPEAPATVVSPPVSLPNPPSPSAAATSPTPSTLAVATPVPATPAPTPKPVPKASTAAGSLAEARQLLERKDYPGAARGFAAGVRSNPDARFSVQLLVACSDETVGKAIASASARELVILPVSYKGKSCYRLCWGLYASEDRASSAVGSVPAYFREGGAKPKVSPTASLLP